MTTFEITITIIAVLGVLLIGFIIYRFEILMSNAIAFFIRTGNQIGSIRSDTVDIFQELNNIEDNILDESKGIPALVDIVDKMHRNLCVEIVDKMVDRVYPPTYNPPCYAPDGICMNPHRDCINCPKRGTGGAWSTNTSIKAKDAPLQEWFDEKKED